MDLNDDKWVIGAMITLRNHNKVAEMHRKFLNNCYELIQQHNSLSKDKLYFIKQIVKTYQNLLKKVTVVPHNGLIEKKNLVNSKKAFLKDKEIKVLFPKDLLTEEAVKSLAGAIYKSQLQYYTVYLNIFNVEALKQMGFEFDKELSKWYKRITEVKKFKPIDPKIINDVGQKAKNYQKEGLGFIEACNGRCLIADAPRVGKTLQALSYIHIHPEIRNVLIVCPSTLKEHWRRETVRWNIQNAKPTILSGEKASKKALKGFNVFIINYDILKDWVDVLLESGLQLLVADECHRVANESALRTQAFLDLSDATDHVLLLSGTPMKHRPSNFYMPFRFIEPTLFGDKFSGKHDALHPYYFGGRFCKPHIISYRVGNRLRKQWVFNGADNVEELHDLVNNKFMLRRLREEVMPEMSDFKQNIPIIVDIDNYSEYKKLLDILLDENVPKRKKFGVREDIRQILASGKLKQAIEWVEDFLETDEKLIVFAHHKFVIDALMKHFKKKAVKIDGSVDPNKRMGVQDVFWKDDSVRLLVASITAAGEGLELAVASNILFLEFPWSSTELDQCSDRVCSMMQKAEKIGVYFMVANKTIEYANIDMIDDKRRTISTGVDGKKVEVEDLLNYALQNVNKGE